MRRLALAALLVPAIAFANGRPPTTNGVYFKPNDNQAMYVRSTFGLLVSRDAGCSFNWVCERAIGYGGEFDPKYAIATDGTIFATTFDGLRVSRDGGCTWVTATAELPEGDPNRLDIWIDALDISATGEIWIATAESAKPNDVYRSIDAGLTFQSRGLRSPTIWWKSVKVAKLNPQRVYLTGYQVAGVPTDGGQTGPQAHLMRSSDGGATWTELELFGSRRDPPDMKFGPTPIVLVSAVDPKSPDTLFLTSLGANNKGDRLYRSIDAGYSFTEVLVTDDTIQDVLFTDGGVYVATEAGGFKSTDGGQSFHRMVGVDRLQCIGQRADGTLVGCGANWEPDFKAVATSPDSNEWSKVFRFVELAGPLQCAEGTTVQSLCEQLWPSLQEQFAATGPQQCGAAPPVDTAVMEPQPPADTGCCDASTSGPSLLLLGGLVVITLGRRRRA